LALAITLGQIGDEFHLLGGNVSRGSADRLQRDRGERITLDAVANDILPDPAVKDRAFGTGTIQSGASGRTRRKIRRREIGLYSFDFLGGKGERAVTDALPLLLDLPTDFVGAGFMHEYLDARLELVVAATE